MTQENPPPGSLTIFTTSWCGFCAMLTSELRGHDLDFRELDIDATPSAAEFVMRSNGGDRTVPTVLFPDGSTATNPSVADVLRRLAPAGGTA